MIQHQHSAQDHNDPSKTHIDHAGYRRFKDSDLPVHLWVAKKKYPTENFTGKEIHHLNYDRLDNSNDNLILLHKDDHRHLHHWMKRHCGFGKRFLKPWAYKAFWAVVIIQVPLLWIPYLTQFLSVIAITIILATGTEKVPSPPDYEHTK